ncbi:MAG: hypothetical protein ACYTGL_07880 [Planctomycetota bacterium]
MKKHAAGMVLAALAGLMIGTQAPVGLTVAQEKAAAPKVTKKSYRRLPNYFGQVGISGTQKDKIYDLLQAAGEKIEELQAQVEAIETKRDEDVRAVLTPEQQKKVDELVAAAKKRAEERRKKRSN